MGEVGRWIASIFSESGSFFLFLLVEVGVEVGWRVEGGG